MCTSQEGDTLVVSAEPVVERACAHVVGELKRRDGGAKRAGEQLSQLRDIVEERVEGKQLGAASNGVRLFPLHHGHLGLGKASIVEYFLGDGGNFNGAAEGDGERLHADDDDERAERLSLPVVGVGERVDESPLDIEGVDVFPDSLPNGAPTLHFLDIVNGTGLAYKWLSLRAIAHLPDSTLLENARH